MRNKTLPLLLLLSGCAALPNANDAGGPLVSTAPIATVTVEGRPATAAAPRADGVPGPLYGLANADPTSSLTCPEFLAMLNARQPRTLEEALGSVRDARPGFLERTTFAYETLHDGAGAAFPRALVYGGDAKLVMSFNGHPKQKGFERLGLMCFDDQEQKFDFKEVAFPGEAASPEAVADLTPEERAQPFVALEGRGARDCRQCHDQNARPVWDAAALWPGFYGGVGDSLFNPRAEDARPIYSALERLRWQAFSEGPLKTGRYRYTSVASPRPNAELTHRLSYLNGRRIVGDLKRLGPAFEPARYHFAAALFCAPRGERLELKQSTGRGDEGATFAVLPENADGETREIFLSAYYDQMGKEKRNLGMLKRYGLVQPLPKERFEELRVYYRGMFREENLDLRLAGVDVDQVLSLRELKRVVEPLGVDIENWSMAFHGGYAFDNGAAAPGRTALRATLERPFAETFLKDDPRLVAALAARELAEESGQNTTAALDQDVCGLIQSRLTPGPRPASVH